MYDTLEITIVKSGQYTFRGIASDPEGSYLNDGDGHPMEDPFLAVYDSFDPASPDEGVVGCNDDLNDKFGYGDSDMAEELSDGSLMEGHQPYFSARLEPGQYTLVLTTWEKISSSEWVAGTGDYGTWATGIGTSTFQLWGPANSMCIGHDPACAPGGASTTSTTSNTLPPTGGRAANNMVLPTLILAGGLALLTAVRRRSA